MSGTLLIVEDDDAYRYTLTRTAEAYGYVVEAFRDWVGVLERVEDGAPLDAALIDLQLPAGTPNGVSLGQLIHARRRDLPIVFFTSYETLTELAPTKVGPVVAKDKGIDAILAEVKAKLAKN